MDHHVVQYQNIIRELRMEVLELKSQVRIRADFVGTRAILDSNPSNLTPPHSTRIACRGSWSSHVLRGLLFSSRRSRPCKATGKLLALSSPASRRSARHAVLLLNGAIRSAQHCSADIRSAQHC
eukprot:772276-Rhodomonas_salina.1